LTKSESSFKIERLEFEDKEEFMAKITINGKEYDIEKLPKEAIDLINSIRFVDAEVQKLQNQIKIHLAARALYMQQLQKVLGKVQPATSDEKIKFS